MKRQINFYSNHASPIFKFFYLSNCAINDDSRIYIYQARMNNESLNNDNIKSYELLNNTSRSVISVIINNLIIIKIQMALVISRYV